MRCPQCGYVSFDHLQTCKRCGAALQEVTRHRNIATVINAPVSVPTPPATPVQAAMPGAAGTQQKPNDRVEQVDALFAGVSGSLSPAKRVEREPQKAAPFHLPLDMLPPLGSSSGVVAPPASAQADISEPARAATLPKAGFWIRLAAWIADVLFLMLPVFITAVLVWATIILGGWLGGEINEEVRALAAYSSAVMVMVSGFLYFTLFVGSCGQTPGKILFGLKVVRADDQAMTFGRACLRALGWILSLLLFSVGFVMIAFTRQRRALHDLLAGTYVVRIQRRF